MAEDNREKDVNKHIANSIVHAYYSSGAYKEGRTFLEFSVEYLNNLKAGVEAVDSYDDYLSNNNSRKRL